MVSANTKMFKKKHEMEDYVKKFMPNVLIRLPITRPSNEDRLRPKFIGEKFLKKTLKKKSQPSTF